VEEEAGDIAAVAVVADIAAVAVAEAEEEAAAVGDKQTIN
jgi:hypothetical protein